MGFSRVRYTLVWAFVCVFGLLARRTRATISPGCTVFHGTLTSCAGSTAVELVITGERVTSIAPDAFINNSGVTSLTLSNNQLESLPDGMFKGMSSLTALHLDNNRLMSIPHGMFHDPSTSFPGFKLTTLNLSNNAFDTLQDDAFHGASIMKTLLISSSNVKTIMPGAFAGVNIGTLDLSNNSIATLQADTFVDAEIGNLLISSSNVKTIMPGAFGRARIATLNLSNNAISTLQAGMFAGARIDNLLISSSDVKTIEPRAFSAFSFRARGPLATLDLSNNAITTLQADTFAGADIQYELRISSSNVKIIEPRAFAGLRIAFLDLSNNAITSNATSLMTGAFQGVTVLFGLDLRHNKLHTLSKDMFQGGRFEGTLNVTHCPLRHVGYELTQVESWFKTVAAGPMSAQCYDKGFATVDWKGAEVCTDCPRGKYCTNGHWNAVKCPTGTFNSKIGSTKASGCTPCPVGTYSDVTGAISGAQCAFCPVGTASNRTGVTSLDKCAACAPGTYAASTGLASCTRCPSGSYSLFGGATSLDMCRMCPASKDVTVRGIDIPDTGGSVLGDEFLAGLLAASSVVMLAWLAYKYKGSSFKHLDFLFRRAHAYKDGEKVIPQRTKFGACCTIFAVVCIVSVVAVLSVSYWERNETVILSEKRTEAHGRAARATLDVELAGVNSSVCLDHVDVETEGFTPTKERPRWSDDRRCVLRFTWDTLMASTESVDLKMPTVPTSAWYRMSTTTGVPTSTLAGASMQTSTASATVTPRSETTSLAGFASCDVKLQYTSYNHEHKGSTSSGLMATDASCLVCERNTDGSNASSWGITIRMSREPGVSEIRVSTKQTAWQFVTSLLGLGGVLTFLRIIAPIVEEWFGRERPPVIGEEDDANQLMGNPRPEMEMRNVRRRLRT